MLYVVPRIQKRPPLLSINIWLAVQQKKKKKGEKDFSPLCVDGIEERVASGKYCPFPLLMALDVKVDGRGSHCSPSGLAVVPLAAS